MIDVVTVYVVVATDVAQDQKTDVAKFFSLEHAEAHMATLVRRASKSTVMKYGIDTRTETEADQHATHRAANGRDAAWAHQRA